MSQVFYRWGAGRDESRVKFDGTHISVFDFKRQVMLDNNLGNGKDFDLVVMENGEEMKDDQHQIARSSSLVVRRRPAAGKGRGTANHYIVGTEAANALTGDHRIEAHAREAMRDKLFGRGRMHGGPMTKRFDGKEEKVPQETVTTGDADEDAKIKAMMQKQSETWEDMSTEMSTQARFNTRPNAQRGPRPTGGAGGPGGFNNKHDFSSAPTDKEPPVGYICYRCGQKGHWIQNCPTNDDPAAQDRRRFVRVTGIPRSMLKTVATPNTGEGSSGGAMLTADGGFVQAVPDQRQWLKQAAIKSGDVNDDDEGSLDQNLTCPICKKLMRDATRTPCCDSVFCEECIQSYLLEHDFECYLCESKIASLDKLVPDEKIRAAIAAHEERKKQTDADEGAEKTEEAAAADVADVSGKNPYAGGLPNMDTLHKYQLAMIQTLRNPLVPPEMKRELRAHVKITNTNLLQMQMLAAQGLIFGAHMGQQMNMMGMGGMGMGMGMPGMPGMGMPGMGMPGMMPMPMPNQNQNHPNNGNGGNVRPPPMRGGFRGGFRGRGAFPRGGGAGRVASTKRPAEDAAGGVEKMQRV